jgi:hypothetical protein
VLVGVDHGWAQETRVSCTRKTEKQRKKKNTQETRVSWAHRVVVVGAGPKKEPPHRLACSEGGVVPSSSPPFCRRVVVLAVNRHAIPPPFDSTLQAGRGCR